MLITLKKDLFGCFRIGEIRDKDNETVFERGRSNRNVNYSAFHIRDARSLRLIYLPILYSYALTATVVVVGCKRRWSSTVQHG